jgi:hypothetical protein
MFPLLPNHRDLLNQERLRLRTIFERHIPLCSLKRFFQEHDATPLFAEECPSEKDLKEFLACMTVEEVQEMLMEEYGENILLIPLPRS